MACAKPPEPGRATPPSESMDFALLMAEERIARALELIKAGDVHVKLEDEFAAIEAAIERMQKSGASVEDIQKMQARLAMVRGEGLAAVKMEAVYGTAQKTPGQKGVSDTKVIALAKEGLARESASRAISILTTPGHWAHETFKEALVRVIEGAGKIPEEYKATLTRDVAMLLRVCPKAGGLVAAMLTRGQPQGSFMRRFQTRGNDAVGAAYEIMGTAALCRHAAPSAKSKYPGRSLLIDPMRDRIVFGPKAFMNHQYDDAGKTTNAKRRSVEADAQFLRKEDDGTFSEIGIDFKHVKDGKAPSNDDKLVKQIKEVGKQIAAGTYDEFHFVTNGHFSSRVKEAVDAINGLLLGVENKESDDMIDKGVVIRERMASSSTGMAKIVLHHHVTSIQNDPFSGGEVG